MKHRYVTMGMLLVLAAPLGQLRAAESDVLALAPADCWGVLYIRNLAEMEKKLTTLVQQLNLPIPMPPNPLMMGLNSLGFVSGVDTAGSVGIVILPSPDFQGMDKHMVMLVPTTNMKEMLSLMEPEEVSGGISKVMVHGQESFVAQKEQHAVLGRSLEAVKSVLENKSSIRAKLGSEQSEHFAGDDLAIWVHAEKITASDAFKAMAPMLQLMGMDPAMLNEVRTLTASLRISSAGLGLGFHIEGVPDTPAYRVYSSLKGTSESLLVGLPKDRCVLSCGGVFTKEAAQQGVLGFDKVFEQPQIKSLPLDPAKLAQVKELCTSMMKPMRGFSLAISGLPEGPEGLVSLTQVTRVEGDPKAIMASMAQLIGGIKGGLITSPEAAPFLAAVEYKAAAETIDGFAVDHISFDMTKVAPASESGTQPEIEAVRKVVGKDGILVRMGAVGSDQIVATFGGGADRFKAVAGLVKAKQSPLAEDGGVKRSQSHLPAKKNMEFYLAVDRLLAVVTSVAKAVEAPLPPLAMPELNAPIAGASTPAGKGATQTEIFVPMELIVAVKDLAMNMMSGGGAPPPAAGADPS